MEEPPWLLYSSLVTRASSSATDTTRSAPPVLLELRNLSDFHASQAQFEVTIDQEVGKTRELVVELAAAEKGCA